MTIFNNKEFFEKKDFQLFSVEKWVDYNTKKEVGAKYKVVIYRDNSDYGDLSVSNAGETIMVKVSGEKAIDYDGQPRFVRLINPRATIYGEFRNELSVHADGLEYVEQSK